jgi:hypothetical protein
MPTTRTFSRAFSGGEVSPQLYGRFDLTRISQALATCRNFIALPHGPAANRPGTEMVRACAAPFYTRLIPFSYNNTQGFAVEFGHRCIRFHALGASLMHGILPAYNAGTSYSPGAMASYAGENWYLTDIATPGVQPTPLPGSVWYSMGTDGVYKIPSPYDWWQTPDLHYTQSADVMTLVHPEHAPAELRRLGAVNWALRAISFAPTVAAPTAPAASAALPGGTTVYDYKATAVSSLNALEESLPSAQVSITSDLTLSGNSVSLTCTAPSDAVRINWYKAAGGLFGYIGQSAPGVAFKDDNINADVSQGPPTVDLTLTLGSGYWPAAVGYFEQRRVFAGWALGPQSVIATRSGTEANMAYHIPTVADDRLAFRIAAREASAIRHIVPLQNMVLLTATNEFKVSSADGAALTGATLTVRPQAYIGANNVQPAVVGSGVLYAQARGGHIREMSYSWQAQSYLTNDISLLAPHLFDNATVKDLAFASAPYPVLWAISSTGNLLGLTYVPEQQVGAWHRHDTAGGVFESCCVVPEDGEDMLYVTTKRTIGGVEKRFVERMHTRAAPTLADSYFVDCGATYSGTPVSTVTGLTWLEGATVNILGDGAVMPPQVVVGGAVSLQAPCTLVHVGLPITADIETLPTAVAGLPDFGQGRPKNVNRAWLRVDASSGVQVGPSFNALREYRQRTTEPYGSPPSRKTGEIEVALDNAWGSNGQVCVRQTAPLPLTLVSVTTEIVIGG